MKEYHFVLAGLQTVLRTPEAVQISERLRPFLAETDRQPECIITVEQRNMLPVPSENGTWHGLEYYDRCGATVRIYHHKDVRLSAFGVTELLPDGNIVIAVLPGYLSYFAGSSGIFNRIGMENLLLQHHGLLLHASLIEYSRNGIAFTGPSGVGKSTQARLWERFLGATVINGDRAVLRKPDARWTAWGSPYAGTSGIYRNENAPLSALVVLKQAKENRLCALRPAEAMGYVYPEVSVHRWDRQFVDRAMDLMLRLLEDVPVYLLECLPAESAARLLKEELGL